MTAWLAFTDSTPENGCVRCIPGLHRRGILPVTETRADGNMLSRGQAIDVGAAEAVDLTLEAGEVSLHHDLAVHGSDANRSDGERIGMTMTYPRPDVRCRKGRDMATLVRGADRFDHFDLLPAPVADMDPAAVAVHAEASRRRQAVIDAPG